MTQQFRLKFPRRPAPMPTVPEPVVYPEPLEDDDDAVVESESDAVLVIDDRNNELLVSESEQLIHAINGVLLPEPLETDDGFVVLDPEPVSPDAADVTAPFGERDDAVIAAPAQADDPFPPPPDGFTLVPEEEDDAPILTEPMPPPARPPKTYIDPGFEGDLKSFLRSRRFFPPPPRVGKPDPLAAAIASSAPPVERPAPSPAHVRYTRGFRMNPDDIPFE
ncbi:MAG: hypothetical protein J0H40_17090 [Rhizobiales bacterium]|nr:hypothetical protein [Hyphomicrobiales bacterium]